MALTVTHAFVSAIADDPVAAAAGEVVPSDWNADHTIAVTSLTIATGTITASEPVLDLSQTWNAGAVTFTGIKLNVTDTASAAGSLLQDWQVGGVSKAKINKAGGITFSGTGTIVKSGDAVTISDSTAGYCYVKAYGFMDVNARVVIGSGEGPLYGSGLGVAYDFSLWWSSSSVNGGVIDLLLSRDAAGALAQRNSTNAQTFRVYGTYTDSSNYVRASLSSSSTAVTLAAETAGTGADNVPVNITPAGTEGVQIGNFAQLTEMTAPAAGAANTARIFAEDNGAGKTRIMAQFASGAAVQIAIEP